MLYHEVMLEDIAGGEETIMKAANRRVFCRMVLSSGNIQLLRKAACSLNLIK